MLTCKIAFHDHKITVWCTLFQGFFSWPNFEHCWTNPFQWQWNWKCTCVLTLECLLLCQVYSQQWIDLSLESEAPIAFVRPLSNCTKGWQIHNHYQTEGTISSTTCVCVCEYIQKNLSSCLLMREKVTFQILSEIKIIPKKQRLTNQHLKHRILT